MTPADRVRTSPANRDDASTGDWRGPYVRYDLVKEFVVAFLAVAVLTVVVSALFSSPDVKPVTIATWARHAPDDFVATAVSELKGTSATAQYGPPYNTSPGAGQKIGPVSPSHFVGVTFPINTAYDFVIGPLATIPNDPALRVALSAYSTANSGQQDRWTKAYSDTLNHATYINGTVSVPPGTYGPVALMMRDLLALARSGGVDGYLVSSGQQFYNTNYTKPLLFISDGSYLSDLAGKQHLQGKQWGMMNETGSYPGQAWLWLYTMWYQITPFSSSGNADVLVWAIMAVLTLVLIFLPFIPGLRNVPRYVGVYRLIWREHYRSLEKQTH